MAPLAAASRLCLRSSAARPLLPAARALSSTAPRPEGAAASSSASYTSPFKGGETAGTKVPDFGKYVSNSAGKNKLFSYFMVGAMGAVTAAGAKSTVQGWFSFAPGTRNGIVWY